MNKVFTPTLVSHSRTFLAVNSGPLSLRIYLWYAAADKQVAQSLQYVLALKTPRHVDRQALTCVLVDQGQHTESTAVARSIGDEVIAPDVILVGWAEPYA